MFCNHRDKNKYPKQLESYQGNDHEHTVMILSFRTDKSGQTVQTQIRLLLERNSLIRVYTVCNCVCIFWMYYSTVKLSCSNFRVITANVFGCPKFLIFTVIVWNLKNFKDYFRHLEARTFEMETEQVVSYPHIPLALFHDYENKINLYFSSNIECKLNSDSLKTYCVHVHIICTHLCWLFATVGHLLDGNNLLVPNISSLQ